MASKVFVFDECPENLQVMFATQSGGNIIGRAVDFTGGGGSSGFVVVDATDASQTFNGDGSAGATQIYPLTIVSQVEADTAAITWKFDTVGVEEGWVVLFNVEGADPANITVTDQDDVTLVVFNTAFPTSQSGSVVIGIYFDSDGAWRLLRNTIVVP